MGRALEAVGYTVLSAASAKEALRASRRWGDGIDVLLTDIVMPGMHGPELASRLRAERPRIGVLYTGGYAEDVVTQGGGFGTPGDFLPKPFTADALTRAVKRTSAAVGVGSPADGRPNP